MKKLAICIPNYNRHEDFFNLLNQSVEQLRNSPYKDDIELCISDDCSSPDISDAVEEIINQNKNLTIKFNRFNPNKGRSYNVKHVISMSDSEYFWVIINDFIYADSNAIDFVYKTVASANKCGIITFPLYWELLNTFLISPNKKGVYKKVFNLNNDEGFNFWFSSPLSSCHIFIEASLVVVNREQWDKYCSIYNDKKAHEFILIYLLIALDSDIMYINEVLMLNKFKYVGDRKYYTDIPTKAYEVHNNLSYLYQSILNINKKAAKQIMYIMSREMLVTIIESDEITKEQRDELLKYDCKFTEIFFKSYLPKARYHELDSKNIILVGCGYQAPFAKHILRKNGIEICCFADNDESKHGDHYLNEVMSIERSLEIQNSAYVITPYANKVLVALYEQLIDIGVDDQDIFILY